jgi:hypothetical protein
VGLRTQLLEEKFGVALIIKKIVESHLNLRWFEYMWRKPKETPVKRND